ncbi:hypothetical protein RRG08_003686 [Elysia crispata]|uniref:Uncharacterized protein n=1 Tax=Elysia crispata TaxID=231223 RepID=A0AAE1E5R0_9GAST|nr:hypothetical protein RRG08_003686 [Elysia crispata]
MLTSAELSISRQSHQSTVDSDIDNQLCQEDRTSQTVNRKTECPGCMSSSDQLGPRSCDDRPGQPQGLIPLRATPVVRTRDGRVSLMLLSVVLVISHLGLELDQITVICQHFNWLSHRSDPPSWLQWRSVT